MARPATHPIKKVVGFDPELLERVRNYRFEQRIESENEAIRRLIEAGLGKKAAAPSRSGSRGARKPRSTGKSASKRQ